MPQTKTTKKKVSAKVGGGGIGTKKSRLSLKLVIPIVLIVAALGGFYIFRKSGASGNYPWVYGPGNWNVSGGEYVNKGAGKDYRILRAFDAGMVKTTISTQQFYNSREICVHYTGGTSYAYISLAVSARKSAADPIIEASRSVRVNSKSGNLCVPDSELQKIKKAGLTPYAIYVDCGGGNGDHVTFDNIYGKW